MSHKSKFSGFIVKGSKKRRKYPTWKCQNEECENRDKKVELKFNPQEDIKKWKNYKCKKCGKRANDEIAWDCAEIKEVKMWEEILKEDLGI